MPSVPGANRRRTARSTWPGVLPTGEKVQGAADLKRVILRRKDEFARNMAAKLLEYALGRELDGPDECTVREVHAAMQKNGYKFSRS